ncbi:UDP-glucose--hexose-1-phosphate uridylyltransferase [Fulvivirga maritima]|uniref:UDP-glucose--hexose-1-phosphate uridylyltransferase n=1 Tax=Fulvivirga maritima TaxID=2904247 RepID=UPI001F31A87A|nr:UDP-glucose--hexose-1-phosphate uridylyltransferase [Fulvivirga maritima]UII27401.1 UDP-glucose--hexose-1-phosphate uridylyltransferase [Fulvivirga maritima]
METFDLSNHSHRRLNVLTGEWVQVSPHRAKRPWQGQQEESSAEQRPQHDPSCYLCAGNTRSNGEVNPDYKHTFSFVNDFASLTSDFTGDGYDKGLMKAKSEKGICKVICFSPRHDLTIPELEVGEIKGVVDLWAKECAELSQIEYVNHIQIFENKGSIMGCSNPHPHGQIWAQESIPVEPAKKAVNFEKYYNNLGKSILEDYLKQELEDDERIIFKNDHFVVLVPFWAVWPYETMIIPKRKMAHITEMTEDEKLAFAEAIQQLTIRYDNLFKTSFPYSSGIHQAPYDGGEYPDWHWHMSFYPPLLRSATVKKFMVGYEMFGNPQRDITPEQAAKTLQGLSDVHYKKQLLINTYKK